VFITYIQLPYVPRQTLFVDGSPFMLPAFRYVGSASFCTLRSVAYLYLVIRDPWNLQQCVLDLWVRLVVTVASSPWHLVAQWLSLHTASAIYFPCSHCSLVCTNHTKFIWTNRRTPNETIWFYIRWWFSVVRHRSPQSQQKSDTVEVAVNVVLLVTCCHFLFPRTWSTD
jgi:hypothetical protein